MRLVSIANCQAGMEIAKPVFTDMGTILVGVGVILTKRMIDHLKGRYVSHVYIRDKATEDIVLIDNIPMELRVESTTLIHSTFNQLQSANHKWTKAVNHQNVEKLQNVFKSIIHELRNNKNAMNLLSDVYTHDNYVFPHSVNVTIYTLAMAVKLGLSEKQLNEIAIGGVFHDMGKAKIPQEVLNKKGKLSKEEFELIKKHAEYGFELLRNQPGISVVCAHCAYQHHEKTDGSGYPRGLKGEEIHPYARIMAVADVFDALTSMRSYRNPMLPHESMEALFAGTGTHFDTNAVEIFRKTVATYPPGVTVKLNTGETAVIVQYLFHAPGRPVVRVVKDGYGKDVDKPYDIDLSQNLSLMITECDAIL